MNTPEASTNQLALHSLRLLRVMLPVAGTSLTAKPSEYTPPDEQKDTHRSLHPSQCPLFWQYKGLQGEYCVARWTDRYFQ